MPYELRPRAFRISLAEKASFLWTLGRQSDRKSGPQSGSLFVILPTFLAIVSILPFLSMHSWYTNTSVSAKDVTQILLGKAFFDFNSGVTVTTNILFEFYHALCSAKEIIDKIIDRTNNRVSLN